MIINCHVSCQPYWQTVLWEKSLFLATGHLPPGKLLRQKYINQRMLESWGRSVAWAVPPDGTGYLASTDRKLRKASWRRWHVVASKMSCGPHGRKSTAGRGLVCDSVPRAGRFVLQETCAPASPLDMHAVRRTRVRQLTRRRSFSPGSG